ncbi:uncharacterized protein LOC108631011 [Ceratina calcarata]|uniref:Uncharacterized protein LOC108631011 n=1 Tax=Ceratina calcarata TaxID=156304 RepID=A0AAJ7JCI5_9HYME|nr:uncharacterized protein LOC108631011 [Ceratina calcarata]
MTTNMKWVIFGIALTIYNCIGQDILFPDDKQIPHTVSVDGTTSTTTKPPLSSDGCPDGMQNYGNATDKICDCKPKFFHFPMDDKCYEVYFQGPCKQGEYVFPNDELIPHCVKNPCSTNGLVMYNDSCYTLNKVGHPCNSSETLSVNETTLQVECLDTELAVFMLITVPPRKCPAGSRRNSVGICKEIA